MNWTGGGLSRSRFAKGSLTAKQKSYFAKARGKLQQGRPPQPEIEFFEFGRWMPERKAVDFSQHHTSNDGSRPVQTTLDDFETTKPLAKRLESLRERHESPKRKRTPLAETKSQAQPRTPDLKKEEPIINGFSPSGSPTSSPDIPAVNPRRPQSSSSKDILNAPSIETKRRRLLEMDDWVGVDRPAMKPVKMKFADPADTDLIGRRRNITKVNCREPADRKRPVGRTSIPARRASETLKDRNQYSPEGNISVRIGSAVDRSEGRAPVQDHSRLSVLSDELLDGENDLLAHEPPPSAPVFNTPGPTPVLLPDRGYREVLRPSAFAYGSSPISRNSNRSNGLRQHQQLSSPTNGFRRFTSNGIDELQEWASPAMENKQAHEDSKCRLVFDDTPRPHALSSRGIGRSPIIRDFAFPNVQTHNTPPRPYVLGPSQRASSPMTRDFAVPDIQTRNPPARHAAESPAFDAVPWSKIELGNRRSPRHIRNGTFSGSAKPAIEGLEDVGPQLKSPASKPCRSRTPENDQIHSDPKVADLSIVTPPSAMATTQILTKFQDRVASNARLEDNMTRTLDVMEKRFAEEISRPLATTDLSEKHSPIRRAEQLPQYQQGHIDTRQSPGRSITELGPEETSTSLLQAPSRAPTTARAQQAPAEQSASIDGEHESSLLAAKNEKALKAAKDEEALWRKIVFGDEQDSDEYVFEIPDSPIRAVSSPTHPLLTHPSLLAEAATSPLKCNPHLADSTFSSPEPVAFQSPTQTYTEASPTEDFTESSTVAAKQSHAMPNAPLYSSPPLPPPTLPRTLVRTPTSSSLLGEASSASQKLSWLSDLSSDELHGPPERLPELRDSHPGHSQIQQPRELDENQQLQVSDTQIREPGESRHKEKVVFKKPTRYVGSHSSDAVEPVVLGERVLRSGRRVSDIGGKEGKRERGRGRGRDRSNTRVKGTRVEQEGSDDDDIVDD